MDRQELRQELNAEVRRARVWLVVVGALTFAMDMYYLYGRDDVYEPTARRWVTAFAVAILVAYLLLAAFVSKKPRVCLVLGLCLFWGLHVLAAFDDPANLYRGLILKIFFTVALVRGLKNANRAEHLKEDLAKVFD